jgi:hypothetical protein
MKLAACSQLVMAVIRSASVLFSRVMLPRIRNQYVELERAFQRGKFMKTTLFSALLATALVLGTGNVDAADKAAKPDKGGLLGNSYASQMELVQADRIRITSRKKVTGSLEEVDTPGKTTNVAYAQIKDVTMVRAAVEAHNLGFAALKILGSRNLSRVNEKRGNSDCRNNVADRSCESDHVMAPGHYLTDVELAIEVTFDMLKTMPTEATDYIDVAQLMKQYGL